MRVGVLTEVAERERRVALTPEGVGRLVASGHAVIAESGCGEGSGFSDAKYVDAGASIVQRDEVLSDADVVLQVRVTGTHPTADRVLSTLDDSSVLIGNVDPLWMAQNAASVASTGATVLALELVPRISRAQTMDVLSSQATVAGYEAALLAATRAPRMFPMLMTAAGTLPPSRVFVLGAGVAGLQAIATAKRLGAVVDAYDVRPAAAEQIRSVGGRAVELDLGTVDEEDSSGYATEQTEDLNARQQRLLAPVISEADVVITTAAIPGAASPELITAAMVDMMRPGSVVIDLAAERGGNCALTVADTEVVYNGVTILGPTDLPSRSPRDSSQMLSNNIVALLEYLVVDGELLIDAEDEVTGSLLVARGGSVCHPRVLEKLGHAVEHRNEE